MMKEIIKWLISPMSDEFAYSIPRIGLIILNILAIQYIIIPYG